MKSFKDYIAEEHPTWHVTFKTGHKPQKVKGRNTAEAIKKAEKRAQRSGEKDPRQLAMYKGIKKVSEEVEQVDEISMDLAKNVFSKRKGQAFDAAHRGDRKLADKLADKKNKTKAYINKREEVELDEADIAEILRQYALSENVNADQLAELTEEEINEIIGKAIGGAFKLGAKSVVGAGRMAKKAANRMSTAGRADAAEKRAAKAEKKNKDRERIKAAQQRLRDAKAKARNP